MLEDDGVGYQNDDDAVDDDDGYDDNFNLLASNQISSFHMDCKEVTYLLPFACTVQASRSPPKIETN